MSTKKVKTAEVVATEKTTKTTTKPAAKAAPKAVKENNINKVTFTLAASAIDNAETVAVLGSFNNWDLNKALFLTKEKNGSFKGTIELTKGNAYEYRFLVNNSIWVNDEKATRFVTTPFGVENCVIEA